MAINVTVAKFKPGQIKVTANPPLWQYDYGQVLQFEGLTLPSSFEVHFSNDRKDGTAKTQVGSDNTVTIPDEYFLQGDEIYAWLYLHQDENDGETEYQIRIPVNERSQPTDEEPTPQEQSAITQAIAALNVAVEKTGEDVIATEEARDAAIEAKDEAIEAKDIAIQAKEDASSSAIDAALSAVLAHDSEEAAASAKVDAEAARDETEQLKADTILAKDSAEAAAVSADTSATNAIDAKDEALGAQSAAESAATNAINAKNVAVTAAGEATTAQTAAENAQAVAESSAADAVSAKASAESAASSAGTAKTAAESAAANAATAKSAAETAQSKAETAQSSAESSAASAAQSATSAGQSASAASSSATSAAGSASSAAESAESAQAASAHGPIIEDRYWYTWDVDNKEYVNTGVFAEGVTGATGETGATGATGATGDTGSPIDVQINGTSIVDDGVANIPIADRQVFGVIKIASDYGIQRGSGGLSEVAVIACASSSVIKEAGNTNAATYRPIVPRYQHESVFYGLAKAAGDSTQSSSDNAVGTYTTEAKAAIASMLGAVTDIQLAGTSIISNNIANIPKANGSDYGVVKVTSGNDGIFIANNGVLMLSTATDAQMKSGSSTYPRAITPGVQKKAVFYGLAQAAGDTTQSSSSNEVGTYTESAKSAIQTMIGVQNGAMWVESVTGTTPTITGEANTRYLCGEVSTISVTPPQAGTIDVRFTSGSTATLLTLPNTVVFPEWFDPTDLESDRTYELCIVDGIYGSVMSWPA